MADFLDQEFRNFSEIRVSEMMIDENDILLVSDDEPEQNRKKAGYINTGGMEQMTSLPGND